MKFYVFDTLDTDNTAMDAVEGTDTLATGPYPSCPRCGGPAGWRDWLPPFVVELELWRGGFADVALMVPDLILSERFCQTYQSAGLSGLKGFEPVSVSKVSRRHKMTGRQPAYFRARPIESTAGVDSTASGCVWDPAPTCNLCRSGAGAPKSWKRIVLEPNTWLGEDIFFPRGWKDMLVTDRFKMACDHNRLQVPPLVPAEEFARDYTAVAAK